MKIFSAFVLIGNGVRADGSTSKINEAIIGRAFSAGDSPSFWTFTDTAVFFTGGYHNKDGMTEAASMVNHALLSLPAEAVRFREESHSYRTHNNAVEGMNLVSKDLADGGTIYIVDHPLHITRTILCFETVNHLYYRKRRYKVEALPCEEVYDDEVYGQPYWASAELFGPRERKTMLVYRILLFRPWARIGLWLLRKVWPSEKQDKP